MRRFGRQGIELDRRLASPSLRAYQVPKRDHAESAGAGFEKAAPFLNAEKFRVRHGCHSRVIKGSKFRITLLVATHTETSSGENPSTPKFAMAPGGDASDANRSFCW